VKERKAKMDKEVTLGPDENGNALRLELSAIKGSFYVNVAAVGPKGEIRSCVTLTMKGAHKVADFLTGVCKSFG